jgi:ribokinase
VGACNMDLIAYVPRLPKEGETLKGSAFEQGFGGKGANQAVQAHLLGADVVFVAKVGGSFTLMGCRLTLYVLDDSYGFQYREKLREYGISDKFVFTDPKLCTGLAPIAVDTQGNNSIIIVTGANDTLSLEELQ